MTDGFVAPKPPKGGGGRSSLFRHCEESQLIGTTKQSSATNDRSLSPLRQAQGPRTDDSPPQRHCEE